MKSLLIALGLALCCLVQAQDQRLTDIDLKQIDGKFYVRAMITNCQKMKEMVTRMPITPVSFEIKSADEVKMTMHMATPHGCKTIHPLIKKKDGEFSVMCPLKKDKKKTVGDVNLSGKTIMTEMTLSREKGTCKIVTFATRDLSGIEEDMKRLRGFADRHGLKGEKIHKLPQEGMCPSDP